MVKALVNQAVKEYTPLEVEEAIVYSSANVKGGWMQYKAYLDKTLKNKWAAGYLETISTTSPAVFPGKFVGGCLGQGSPMALLPDLQGWIATTWLVLNF